MVPWRMAHLTQTRRGLLTGYKDFIQEMEENGLPKLIQTSIIVS